MILLNALTINSTVLFLYKSKSKTTNDVQILSANESIIFWHNSRNTGQFDADK